MDDSGVDIKDAQNTFLEILNKLNGKSVPAFLNWVTSSFSMENEEQKPKYIRDANAHIAAIAEHLRQKVPTKGYLQSEKIAYPKVGLDAECNDSNTIHVDCFLFDEEAVEDLVQEGKISRNYCLDCGSKNTKPLTFISHSLAPTQLEFIFTKLVPLIKKPQDFKVIDIGSRLGSVIFSAHYFSAGSSCVTGVELNEDLCKIQKEVVEEFNLTNVNVICSDIRNQPEVIKDADLIIMNNVFNFFMELGDQLSCWQFLHDNVKPGCLLIHHPSVYEAASHLTLPFDISEWLEEISITRKCAEFAGGDEELFMDCKQLHFYKVRSRN
ncbi:unnamed protein product [Auanema sp. JU1783]|nr:unnamed protein product [Auanema sp. JU1783]